MVMVHGNTYIVENIYKDKIHNIENGFITMRSFGHSFWERNFACLNRFLPLYHNKTIVKRIKRITRVYQ